MFKWIVAFFALGLAVTGAFFSVTGISLLFQGAFWSVVIMASMLEASKLVAASFLHRYWKEITKGMRIYLTTAVVLLMLITSVGIYGYLSNAYQITSNEVAKIDNQIKILEDKKAIIHITVDNNNKLLQDRNRRIDELTQLRKNQEKRLEDFYKKEPPWWLSIRKTEKIIADTDQSLKDLNDQIKELGDRIASGIETIGNLDIEILDIKNNDHTAAEVGPLKYLAKITGKTMDAIAGIFILLLIFIFDPLAISLVIAANFLFERESNNTNTPVAKPDKDPPKKEEKNKIVTLIEKIKPQKKEVTMKADLREVGESSNDTFYHDEPKKTKKLPKPRTGGRRPLR